MADTTVTENESNAVIKTSNSYELLSHTSSDFQMSNYNYLDTNKLVYGNCDILPNNNVCTSKGLSHCYDDVDCSSSIQQNDMTTYGSDLFLGSSFGDTSQNCETLLFQPADTTAGSEFMAESQYSSHFNHSQQHNQTEDKLVEYNSIAVNKSENYRTNKTNHLKKLSANSDKSNCRGRRRKAFVAMYHSQISGDKNAIKIRIKKSDLSTQLPPTKKKSGRRKKHKINSDTDTSDHESRRKRSKPTVIAESVPVVTSTENITEESKWANMTPDILHRIFQTLCMQEGCLPTVVRLCKVCKNWRNVALSPLLWRSVDLNWVQEKLRTDLKLHWLIQNRLMACQELNLAEWKVHNIQLALEALSEHCPELRGLNLGGWKGLNAEHLKYLTTEFSLLERLDLSSINNTSAINAQPLVSLAQMMGSRLTHLVLAHNKIAGFTQVITSIASHCPNLQLLDLSNIRTFAQNTALLHVEKLQVGCPKLRVLRITNSQIWLASASLSHQVASPGFPMLEELSLAGAEGCQLTARSIDDEGIERILKTSTKLRLLDVRGCARLTDSGLVRVPAWDLEHLFLSACYVTRLQNSGLELILQKWSHSLLEVDLAWSTATSSLDAAVLALAEKGVDSPLRTLNLCGSSVSLEPVKAVLIKCPKLHSINLQSCRALPRGMKRLYIGEAISDLRQSL
ncbi:hypothetical protein PPYR_14909 [Photinus pyralis]|uniref:F-box domain-containing protein n=1 Tax=Photinus pyralis TaxID=7054 RepID=A0A5N4A035_PHOPY|nr:F-box/LRR-repeat protein 6 [Photinus pyralis]KAB0790656.1 hypothetical protein PPYR_14909 [Photinus pyralis]